MSDPGLETARTRLVPFSPGLVAALTAVFRDPGVRRWLLDDTLVDASWTAEEVEASSRRFATSGAGMWAVRVDGRPEVVGFVGFRPFFEPPRLQLLYGLLPALWGRGLATEIARAVCAYAFESLRFEEIEAAVDVPNVASARVLERIGFRPTHRTTGSQPTAFYSLTREEWTRAERDSADPTVAPGGAA